MSDLSERIAKLAEFLRGAKRIAVLSGAGMSTESGIPDFRSSSGIYKTLCSEEIFDIDRFNRRPEDFYKVLAPVYGAMMDAQPNGGHLALARLEGELGKSVCVATQNIDDLHQKAGSVNVQEVHGSMMSLTCLSCGGQLPLTAVAEQARSGQLLRHSMCGGSCHGVLKPDIVFYGEGLPQDAFTRAYRAFTEADVVMVLGTSLAVYPAASLPGYRRRGSRLVIMNMTPTPLDGEADLVFREKIGETLPQAVALIEK